MMWKRWIALPLIAASLAGCVRATDCEWAEPILPSPEDRLTDGTARQLLTHNERGALFCGWRPPNDD